MAQFDVHRNIGKLREDIPYVVLVQSSLYDNYRRRVLVPLVRKSLLGKIADPAFNPTFRIENVPVVLHPLEIASVSRDQIGKFVVSIADDGERIINALDRLLSRAWK